MTPFGAPTVRVEVLKAFLRKPAERTVKAVVRGIIGALGTIRKSDALGYFDECGYATQ